MLKPCGRAADVGCRQRRGREQEAGETGGNEQRGFHGNVGEYGTMTEDSGEGLGSGGMVLQPVYAPKRGPVAHRKSPAGRPGSPPADWSIQAHLAPRAGWPNWNGVTFQQSQPCSLSP